MSKLDEHKLGAFLCSSLVLDVVSCSEGNLNWSARFWERRGFRVVITADMPAVLCLHWCLCLKRMLYVYWQPHVAWCGHAWCLKGKCIAGFVKKKAKWGCWGGEVTPLQEKYGHLHRWCTTCAWLSHICALSFSGQAYSGSLNSRKRGKLPKSRKWKIQIIAVAWTCWEVKLSGYPKQSLHGCS